MGVEITKTHWHLYFCRTVLIYSLNLNDWIFPLQIFPGASSLSVVANGFTGV